MVILREDDSGRGKCLIITKCSYLVSVTLLHQSVNFVAIISFQTKNKSTETDNYILNQTWGQLNSGIGIDYLKKNGIRIEFF